jgi:hypothetical protein
MKVKEITLGALFALVTRHLPKGWELRLTMTREEVSLDLFDKEGRSVYLCLDDLDASGMVLCYLNHARSQAGMAPVDWNGNPVAE